MTLVEQLRLAGWEQVFACALGAYALGCFNTGYYLVRARTGRDIRALGSGATGARNVGRILGIAGFLETLAGDFFKGILAVWAARQFTGTEALAPLAMLVCVAGHIWPAQLTFRGGKGVATSLGALLIYDWRVALSYAMIFAVGFLFTRRTILPGLFAYVALPFMSHWLDRDAGRTVVIALIAVLVCLAHRSNLAEEFLTLAARRNVTPHPEKTKL